MQLIMQPAAPPSLAISTAPAPPSCIPDHHDVHNESSSRPSFCPSPAINSAPPSSHGASPPRLPPDCIPISSAHNLSPAPGALLPSYSLIPLQGGPDQAVPSHCCKSCNRNFSCSHALGAHMHAHDSFYALCEGAGSSADIMSKADNQQDPNQKQNDSKENELLIDLSSSCKSETEDQYEEDELLYVVRRKPKRSRHSVDREDLPSKSVNVAGNDIHESVGRIVRAGSFKKPMFTCKLQDRPPPACTECGREFNSWKALFGHMRCHPEREWRGIQPPAEHIQNGARALKDSIARNSTLESNSFIVVKPLRTSKQCDMLKRKDMSGQCRSGQPAAYPSHELIKANCNQFKEEDLAADDTVLAGSIREDGLKLSWNSCRKQVMLEEEEESDTESIEAAYMSSNFKDEEDKCLHLLASFSRGKRSKRSHFTVKSLRSVQDKLAAKVAEGANEPKDEDLEMANCLVMLALAGSVGGGDREGGTASKSVDRDIDDDDDDVYEGTVNDQLKLTWGSNGCTTGDDSELKIPPYQNDMITTASNLDDAIINAGEGGKYECAACKRSFKSHQALGGHRASHKKVKGCFAKTAVDVEAFPMTSKDGIAAASTTYFDPSMLTLAAICKEHIATSTPHLGTSPPEMKGESKHSIETGGMCTGGVPAYDVSGGHTVSGKLGGLNKAVGAANFTEKGSSIQLLLGSMDGLTSRSSSKLVLHNPSKSHQCSICQRVFSSGQALGGHKRCHWAADKADRHAPETGTGISAMACVAAPPTGVAKLTFFTRPPAVEEATHHEVKVLGIDLNIPASFDVDPVNSPNAIKANTCKNNRSLGSLLSLGHCSGVSTIHAPIDVNDESFQSAGRYMAGQSSTTDPVACSGTSSPSSTTSIHVSETGPCL